MNDLIEKLSNLRSQFNCFDENELDAYSTLSEAIKVLSERPELCEDAVSRRILLNDLRELITAWEKYPVMAEQIKGVKTAIRYVEMIPCEMNANMRMEVGKKQMKIRDLIKQLEDMLLIYGDRTILTITDIESEYSIKEIKGKMCAKYFEPSDHVAEVTVRIKRNSSIKTLPSVTPNPEPCEDDKGCSNCMYSGRPTYKSPCSECRNNSQWEMKPISRSYENGTECEDAVSREQVLKLFSTHDGKYLYEAIQMLPSVTLKPDHSGDTTEMVE